MASLLVRLLLILACGFAALSSSVAAALGLEEERILGFTLVVGLLLLLPFLVRPRLCRPYRAKTKGKVERFNGYLKGSFLVPLAATLKSSGLKLDAQAANAHVGRWLSEVANARVHATTKERPDHRLAMDRATLLPLPGDTAMSTPAPRSSVPTPIESLQHPLSVYDALLQVSA